MKKIWLIALVILCMLFAHSAFSCALPPDVLYEWEVDTREPEVRLTLTVLAWKNLHTSIENRLTEGGKIPLNEENLEAILQKNIVPLTQFSVDTTPVTLKFLSGMILTHTSQDPVYASEPEPVLKATFQTQAHQSKDRITHFSLVFDKTPFLEISPLIHPYIVTDIQKNSLSEGYVIGSDNRVYDVFSAHNRQVVIRNTLDEFDRENHFDLFV